MYIYVHVDIVIFLYIYTASDTASYVNLWVNSIVFPHIYNITVLDPTVPFFERACSETNVP